MLKSKQHWCRIRFSIAMSDKWLSGEALCLTLSLLFYLFFFFIICTFIWRAAFDTQKRFSMILVLCFFRVLYFCQPFSYTPLGKRTSSSWRRASLSPPSGWRTCWWETRRLSARCLFTARATRTLSSRWSSLIDRLCCNGIETCLLSEEKQTVGDPDTLLVFLRGFFSAKNQMEMKFQLKRKKEPALQKVPLVELIFFLPLWWSFTFSLISCHLQIILQQFKKIGLCRRFFAILYLTQSWVVGGLAFNLCSRNPTNGRNITPQKSE